MNIQSIKELILLGIATLLLAGMVGIFIYMINTENSEKKMMSFLSLLQTQVKDEQKNINKKLDTELLKEEKFQELKVISTSSKEFDISKRNPFQSFQQ